MRSHHFLMKNSSKNLRHKMNVRSAAYRCQLQVGNINRAVEKFYVLVVSMQLIRQIIVNFAHFAELLRPIHMQRQSEG